MSTATAEQPKTAAPANVTDYVTRLAQSDPATALQIALAETERQRAIAAQQAEELRSRAEVELDANGNFRPKNLAGLWRLGQMYARSALVPEHYRGKPEDCAIGVQMALRCKVDILTFLQSSYIVHGKPGIEAKLAIAMINSSGQIKGRIRWKFEGTGKDRKCTAIATDALTGEIIEQTVTWATVVAEGWLDKKGSKWQTIPDLMFQYRTAMWLARTNFPDVLMGMKTVDELEDSLDTNLRDEAQGGQIKSLDDLTNHIESSLVTNGSEATEPVTTAGAVNGPAPSAETTAETPTETAKSDTPDLGNPLEGAAEKFAACTALAEVNDVHNKISEHPAGLSEDEEATLNKLAEEARERIRSTRGARAKEQKTLT